MRAFDLRTSRCLCISLINLLTIRTVDNAFLLSGNTGVRRLTKATNEKTIFDVRTATPRRTARDFPRCDPRASERASERIARVKLRSNGSPFAPRRILRRTAACFIAKRVIHFRVNAGCATAAGPSLPVRSTRVSRASRILESQQPNIKSVPGRDTTLEAFDSIFSSRSSLSLSSIAP